MTPSSATIAERLDHLITMVEALLAASQRQAPRFIGLAVAAERVGLSVDAVRDLIARGTLRGFRPVKGRVLVEVAELDKLVLASTAVPATGRGRRRV